MIILTMPTSTFLIIRRVKGLQLFKNRNIESQNHLGSVLTGFPAASLCTLWGGSLLFLSSFERTLTILEWIPQPMQYCILM